jgi:cobalt-precorrin 5A hydrolase
MHLTDPRYKLAIWAVTPKGAGLATRIAGALGNGDILLSESLTQTVPGALGFDRLADAVTERFGRYDGHVFVMSAGIVVRVIAPHIRYKTVDPAVVVVADGGGHAISLLAGHIGGANRLTLAVAAAVGADPVITTATDIHQVPAIDVIATDRHLAIENPEAIKHVSMALLTGSRLKVHDPHGFLKDTIPPEMISAGAWNASESGDEAAGIFVDDIRQKLPPRTLRLRPPTLAAGMGCNRNTEMAEMKALLLETLASNRLVPGSLCCLASIDIKHDEPGLVALAKDLAVPLVFFTKEELNRARGVASPSAMAKKHVGVESVCEAAAILAAQNGRLIVPKQRTKNVTVAIARKVFTS